MGTIVEATIPAEQFALSETLRRRPGAEFETVRVVTDGTDRLLPFLWATAVDRQDLPSVVDDDPSTRAVDVLTAFEGEYLFRIEWADRIRTVCDAFVEERGAILAACGTDGAWTFRVLFPERGSISPSREAFEARDVDVAFERICDLSESFQRGRHGLTESQYETILAAYDRGYYAVPRETTLAELATELGVSHQALSERLRRGHGTLVERVLRPRPNAPFQS